MPLVRTNEVARDIDAVVNEVLRRTRNKPVLLGWATGGHWAGYYASLHSDKLSGAILLNTIFGVDAPHKLVGRGSDMEDPKHPGRFNYAALGAYRCSTEASLIGAWDRNIPVENKDDWRDPAVARAYLAEAMKSDPESVKKNPPCLRSPSGPMEDTFYSSIGRQFWDASLVTVPVLIIASERDFWSRPEDRARLQEELVHSPDVRVVVIPKATHFVFLDRADHGRKQFLDVVNEFLVRRNNKKREN
jgi:pimeloyl-ACP methyl ester carboxylesterase